jgi:hypothetical protein
LSYGRHVLSCNAQNNCVWTTTGVTTGNQYKNPKLGFSYAFPAGLVPQDATLLPKDKKGRGAILFALWKTPDDIGVPSVMLFVEDPTQYHDPSALAYAHRIENTAARTAKTFGIKPFDLASMSFYRVDYQEAAGDQLFNAAITGQIDQCEVSFQLRARSQPEIDKLVESVKGIKPDHQPGK